MSQIRRACPYNIIHIIWDTFFGHNAAISMKFCMEHQQILSIKIVFEELCGRKMGVPAVPYMIERV